MLSFRERGLSYLSSLIPSSEEESLSLVSSPRSDVTDSGRYKGLAGLPPSFADGYESMGGVPGRTLEPSEEGSAFTCYAFSDDRSLLVTGESNGSVKLWTTRNYTCIASQKSLFDSGVACLRFYPLSSEVLTGYDYSGNMSVFTLNERECYPQESARVVLPNKSLVRDKLKEQHAAWNAGGDNYTSEIQERRVMQLSQDGQTVACSVITWATRGNTIDVLLWTVAFRFGREDAEENRLLGSITSCVEDDAKSLNHLDFHKCFSLAENGQSLISVKFTSPKTIAVYPRLRIGIEEQEQCIFEDACAAWGRNGEYLMVWNERGNHPYISVYATAELSTDLETSRRLASRNLDLGLIRVEAQMLEPSTPADPIEVLIAEVSDSGRARVLLWDATNKSLKREVNMSLNPTQSLTNHQPDPSSSAECKEPDRGHLFCITENKKWLGVFSQSFHTCALLSLECGTVMWTFSLPKYMRDTQPWRTGKLLFDAYTRKMVLFTEGGVFAFAPAALNPDIPSRAQTITLEDLAEKDQNESEDDTASVAKKALPALIEMSRIISPEAFSEALCKLPTARLSELFGMTVGSLTDVSESSKLTSIDISVSGQYLSCITQADNETRRIKICELDSDQNRSAHHFPGLQFPMAANSNATAFSPLKLRFHPTRSQEDGLVLLPDESLPFVIFCNPHDESHEVFRIHMEKCLLFCQTEDRCRMCILGASCVHVLDLSSRCVIKQVNYQVNFCQAIERVRDLPGEEHYHELFKSGVEQIMSEDGTSVVLGCDSETETSVIATPTTSKEECEELLDKFKRNFDAECLISGNGLCTYRYLKLSSSSSLNQQREVTICSRSGGKIFRVLQPSTEASHSFANLSADGVLLSIFEVNFSAAVTLSLHDMHRTLFSLYSAEQFMPDYQRLRRSRGSDLSKAVEGLVKQYGAHVFNGPPSAGITIAQEVAENQDQEALDSISSVSKKLQIELALGWRGADNNVENLLHRVLEKNSTNSIQDVIHLIRDDLVPFKQAATIVKDSFKELSIKHRRILEAALSDNTFVFEACRMRVHVDFLDSKHRNDTALHIDTTDRFLDWKNVKDLDALNRKWRMVDEKRVKQLEKQGNTSTVMASLRFVCVEDAARAGMAGIIRPLLLQRAPAHFYQFDAVKWVIQYKWNKIWKSKWLLSVLQFLGFLGCFTGYAIIVGGSSDLKKEDYWIRTVATLLVVVNFAFSAFHLVEEMQQLKSFAADAKEHFQNWWLGIQYYFSSWWNLLDLFTCCLTLVLIPCFHCLEVFHYGYETGLSICVALGVIGAYIKVWYFAQPYEKTGAQVLMVNNIVQDSSYFLFLAFVVLCGFAFGLRALLRHSAFGNSQDSAPSSETNANSVADSSKSNLDPDTVKDAFGNPFRSVETMFYALLGTFELEVMFQSFSLSECVVQIYNSSGDLSWLISLVFIIYLISLVILLLNLLISTMGDTYDRVKSTEQAQLLMGRASFIDACEAALSDSKRKELEKQIQKYICVLVDPENVCDEEPPDQWMGKLTAIDRGLKANIQKVVRDMETKLRQQRESIIQNTIRSTNELETKVAEMLKESVAGRQAEIAESSSAVMETQRSKLVEELQRTLLENIQGVMAEDRDSILATLKRQISERITSELEQKEARIIENVRRAMNEQEARLVDVMNSRMAASNAQMLRIEETNQALQSQLGRILTALQQRQEH